MPQKDYYQVSLKVILKNDKDEVLILNGHPKGSFADFYDLPGGRIDEEEFTLPFVQIIKREIIEEIGNVNTIVSSKPVAIGRHLIPASMASEKKDIHILYVFFEAKLVSGEVVISEEHDGFKWVKLNEHEPATLFKSGILEGMNMYLSRSSS